MGFLTGIKSVFRGKQPFRTIAQVDADADALIKAIEAGDQDRILEVIRPVRGGEWDDRYFFCDVVVEHAPAELLEALRKAHRRDAIAHLLVGAKETALAWDARGPDDTLTSESWETFTARLDRAQRLLKDSARLDPVDPTPHVYLLTVARGLQDADGSARTHFETATARDPLHFAAHAEMLALCSETWGGTHDEMFDFARKAVAEAPEGNEIWLLLLLAHLEKWYFSYAMDGDEEAASQWISSADARQEVATAYSMSLFSDFHVPGKHTLQRRNEAAFWFYLTGDRQGLRREMQAIGHVYTELPWAHLGDPRENFVAARKAAGL